MGCASDFDLQHRTRIGAMNPFSFVAPVFQPARRADWKVGVTAARFMDGERAAINVLPALAWQNRSYCFPVPIAGRTNPTGEQGPSWTRPLGNDVKGFLPGS
jgi:hypothetical protein